MGTSLSGLTPATTFDGLLKTSDNDALDATLKTIGTGDGTDSVLQLSNSALQVNGPTTINGAQMTIVGATNDNTTNALVVQNSDGIELLKVRNERYAQLGTSTIGIQTVISSNANWIKGNANYLQDTSSNYYGNIGSSGIQIGNGSAAATARLQVKGSGATSATASLLVQNSAGTQLLKINDDGSGFFGTYLQGQRVYATATGETFPSLSFAGSSGTGMFQPTSGSNVIGFAVLGSEKARLDATGLGIGETIPTARLHVKGSGNTNTTNSLFITNSDGTEAFRVQDNRTAVFSGSSSFNGSIYANSPIFASSNLTAGSGTIPASTRAYIKGSGATSATTALLVQNSAGTDLLKVEDGGNIRLGGNMYASQYIFNKTASATWIQFVPSTHQIELTANANKMVVVKQDSVGINTDAATSMLQVKGSGNTATTTALLVQNSDADNIVEVLDSKRVNITAADGATGLHIDSVNGSTTGNAITIGSDDNKFRLGNYYNYGVIAVPNSKLLLSTAQGVGIGDTFTNASGGTARLFVKGSGATSATTALLVQNSAGTDLLKIEDGGNIVTSGFTFQSNILKPNVNGYIGVDRNNNRTFSVVDSNATRTYLNIQSSSTSNFADVSINTDHLVVKKEGNVAVGTSTLNASAKLQVDSTTQGFLPPRMTTTERDAITTPAAGLMIYNTTTNKAQCYNGTAWQDLF